jgi:hypothetical protein
MLCGVEWVRESVMNDEEGRVWNESIVAYLKIIDATAFQLRFRICH